MFPKPPYYAVIFVSSLTGDLEGYEKAAAEMEALAELQEGFLGVDTARSDIGITVSYWESEDAIRAWREQVDHALARDAGRDRWYDSYRVHVARVERSYQWERGAIGDPGAPGRV